MMRNLALKPMGVGYVGGNDKHFNSVFPPWE